MSEFKGDQKPTNSISAASSAPLFSTGKSGTSLVGFDNELYQLKDVLTGLKSSLQVISIVGMGGAGKTTLAQTVYRDYVVLRHFDLRAWATISQKYKVREILLQILSFSHGKYADETADKLGERLHKSLFGRRYLIILDDIWSVGIWESIKFFFPDNGNGSRVILTTRQLFIATHLSSFLIRIELLDEHKSWNLFCQEVFGHQVCPPKLVGIGKKIVKQCKGLPLAIVVIGGFLRKSCMTEEHCLKVATNMNAILNSRENGKCLNVLYLSYDNLPARLKPCFLYMGTYKEDCEISVSEVTKLWVAEGFLKPNGVQSHLLEEIAEDYLKDHIDRNLIVVSAYRSNGKIKSCRMHDLLRELCLCIADKEKFFCAVRADSIPGGLDRERRLVFQDEASSDHNSQVFKSLESASLARSLICDKVVLPVKCKLLRVLHKGVDGFMEDEIRNVNLRYLDLLVHGDRFTLPTWISLIWNLQTLIIGTENQLIVAPLAIWEMQQLRHLKSSMILLPDPPPSNVVLRNLQTLANVVNFRLSEEVCKRIPNIKKLSLTYGDMLEGYDHELNNSFHNLGSLQVELFLSVMNSTQF